MPSFDLIATLGPASFGMERELAAAGATAFRVNAAHVDPEGAESAVDRAKRAVPEVPVIVDLRGAKMRIGEVAARPVAVGTQVRFSLGSEEGIPVPHAELFVSTEPGDTLSLDDDRMRFRVESVGQGSIFAVCVVGGQLASHRGLNVVEHPVLLDDLTESDARTLERVGALPGVHFAVSFVADGSELEWVRRRTDGATIIAKIERREAVDRLSSIADVADALWICRGDLGAQIGMVELASFVGRLDPRKLPAPVAMAGQVFEHLTHHAAPTRSEVCHLADLVGRGYAGIVLSDETAIGRDPRAAVALIADLAQGLRALTPGGGP